MANTYLKRTNGTPTNSGKGTFSFWVKKCFNSNGGRLIMNYYGPNDYAYIRLHPDNYLQMYEVNNGSMRSHYKTNRLFRDTNAWYHFQFVIDTSESTATDRFKIYVNGELETSYNTQTFGASSGFNLLSASGSNHHTIGSAEDGSNSFDGLMSHVHFCDGTALAPTVFGSTDSTTGEWKINTNPSFTPGNNGYTILKDGNTITDQSTNSNDFTLGAGTLTKTEDNPSNNFATFNPVHIYETNTDHTWENGNTRYYSNNNNWGNTFSSLGFTSGKFYAEAKIINLAASNGYGAVGVVDINKSTYSGNDATINQNTNTAGVVLDYRSGQSALRSGASTVTSNIGNFSNGDILGLAVDMDNKALYVHLNGTYYQINSVTGVPTSGSSKTGAITIPATCETACFNLGSYASVSEVAFNFGNGYFETTAVSSAGTNASGNGIFEYDVPTGYTALSTKGLNL